MSSGDIDGIIYNMATELAPFDSSVADAVNDAIISKISSLLPSYTTIFGNHKYYKHYYKENFFPDYLKHAYEDYVPDIGLEGFGVALVCKSISRYAEPSVANSMYVGSIDQMTDRFNIDLRPSLYLVYSEVIKTYWPQFKIHYNKVKNQLSIARAKYRALLIASAHDHAIWYATNQWESPHTECFHHWMKYMALGASIEQIDDLIRDVKAAGFPVPYAVDFGSWQHYQYPHYSPISHENIDDDVIPAITKTVRDGYPSSSSISSFYSKRFTMPGTRAHEPDGPGMQYRDYGSSCFRSGTLVLMADRQTLIPVENLRPGDEVWSPSAKSAVPIALIARPSVSGRPLYCLNEDSSFLFTDAHPFLVYRRKELAAHVACVSPEKLTHISPTWSAFGIDSLASNSTNLIQVSVGRSGSLVEKAFNVSTVGIAVSKVEGRSLDERIQSVKANPSSHERLYDVILDKTRLCDGGIPVDYVAGSRNMLLRVAGEVPPLAAAEPNVIIIVQSIITAVSDASKRLDEELQQKNLSAFEHWHQLTLIQNQIRELGSHLGSSWFHSALLETPSTTFGSPQSSQYGEYVFTFSNITSRNVSALLEMDPHSFISKIGRIFSDEKQKIPRSQASHGPSDEDDIGNFRSVMSYLYDQFIRNHTLEMRAFLDLGFRTIPLPPPSEASMKFKDGTILAVSIWGVEFHASRLGGDVSHCRNSNVTEMEIAIESASLPLHCDPIAGDEMLDVSSPRTNFWSSCTKNRIFYFSLSDSLVLGLTECHVRLAVKVCDRLKLAGDSYVHLQADRPYMQMSIALDENVDTPVVTNPYQPSSPKSFVEQARLWGDLRLLSKQQVKREITRSKDAWTHEQKREQAVEFSLGAGKAYSKISNAYIAGLSSNAN